MSKQSLPFRIENVFEGFPTYNEQGLTADANRFRYVRWKERNEAEVVPLHAVQ